MPPILDHDGQEDDEALPNFEDPNYNSEAGGRLAALKQMDQTSNLIVREMQKFVCRHASDVSQVLPLPLPANSRQQSRIQSGNKSSVQGIFLSINTAFFCFKSLAYRTFFVFYCHFLASKVFYGFDMK